LVAQTFLRLAHWNKEADEVSIRRLILYRTERNYIESLSDAIESEAWCMVRCHVSTNERMDEAKIYTYIYGRRNLRTEIPKQSVVFGVGKQVRDQILGPGRVMRFSVRI